MGVVLKVRVAAAALNQTPLDWRGNLANVLETIREARNAGAALLCLPELCLTGYGCEDAFLSRYVQRRACEMLFEVEKASEGMIVLVGLPLFHRNALFNTAALLVDGRLAGFAAKRYLALEGIHYEPRWFKPWPEGLVVEADLEDGRTVPLGDLVFDCGGVRIGCEICEDAWAADRPGARLSRLGTDVILNPSASHFAFGKLEIRRRFVIEGSRAFGVCYVYSNLVGNEAGRIIYDGGALIANAGSLVAEGPRFIFRDRCITCAVVDLELTRTRRLEPLGVSSGAGEAAPCCVRVPFDWSAVSCVEAPAPLFSSTASAVLSGPGWEYGPALKEEEFTRAVALGLFDYLRKSGARGYVVSLSGGADSSAVSLLVHLALRLALDELGLDGVVARLPFLAGVVEGVEESSSESLAALLIPHLLRCVYQRTRNNSEATLEAARAVAEGVGASFHLWDVDDAVEFYERTVASSLGVELDWEKHDVARQNVQARARVPGAWLLANLTGSILLCTSNRSEAAVGYATMDGDTAGGLSPIAGIDKAFLRGWLRWMEEEGPESVGPFPFLEVVNALEPSAELRPRGACQTDEADLMPYEVLDVLERAAVRDKYGPADVLEVVRVAFPDYEIEVLKGWVRRFFRLWSRNQWKRERYAPSFHLDDENLDPRSWCRFPILSGGFEDELESL